MCCDVDFSSNWRSQRKRKLTEEVGRGNEEEKRFLLIFEGKGTRQKVWRNDVVRLAVVT
jgi:hypothetical protein